MVFASLWPLKWSQDSFHTHSDVSLDVSDRNNCLGNVAKMAAEWQEGLRSAADLLLQLCMLGGNYCVWTHIISAFLYVLWQLRSRTNCKEDIIYFNHSFGVFQVFPTSKKAHYSPSLAPFCSLLTPEVNVWLFSSWMLLNVTSLSHTFCACLRWASNSRVQQWKQAPWEQWT